MTSDRVDDFVIKHIGVSWRELQNQGWVDPSDGTTPKSDNDWLWSRFKAYVVSCFDHAAWVQDRKTDISNAWDDYTSSRARYGTVKARKRPINLFWNVLDLAVFHYLLCAVTCVCTCRSQHVMACFIYINIRHAIASCRCMFLRLV